MQYPWTRASIRGEFSLANESEILTTIQRTISTTMRRVGGAAKANPNASYLFTAWGQFLTHDIIQTPDVGKGEVPCDCKANKRSVYDS